MLSTRTIIGLVVGVAIITIGGYSLFLHVGPIIIQENAVLEVGDEISYTIPAPAGTAQHMMITGDAFDVRLESPGDFEIPNESYKKEKTFDWTHQQDGETRILVQNTGNTEISITGELTRSSDPIWFTYDIMVITSGMVIIGFSMGFTLRRPKGF